jgi:cytoskeleton protein RodZ
MEERKQPPFPVQEKGKPLPSFGEHLKRERELREITIREISDETKVSCRYLEALEQDNRSKLPAEVFIKGFVRSYANYIGLDPDEAILRYQEYQKTLQMTGDANSSVAEPPKSEPKKEKKNYWTWGILVLLILAVLFYYGYTTWNRGDVPPVSDISVQGEKMKAVIPLPAPDEALDEKLTAPSSDVMIESKPEAETIGTPETASLKPLDITLSAVERTWLAVDVDSSQHYDVTLQPGEEIHFSMRDEMRLTIGNAGGLLIETGGRRFGPLGESGRVVKNFLLTRKDLQGDSLE